jgi:MFS family permease
VTGVSGDRLFTPRFFVMCGFSFTVFLSALQLLPTAPFHIHDLGGSTAAAGLFLGLLTYSSAFSAPITGALADRYGRTRQLLVCSLAIAGFSALYAIAPTVPTLLILVPMHGVVWSGLLSASAAYMINILPPTRRAEGIGYWGLSSVMALAVAPPIGFWIYRFGWFWLCMFAMLLNLVMAAIAWRLQAAEGPSVRAPYEHDPRGWVEWRVLLLSLPLFLYSFAYGGITSFSAMYADSLGVTPKSVYLTTLAVVILVTRPILGPLGDRFGYRRVFAPCLVLITAGLVLLAAATTRSGLILSAVVFGTGFGTAYPVFAAYVTHGVREDRRGAAFGAILAAFDTGIGTGSSSLGWLISSFGYGTAFGVAAGLSALALPAFFFADRQVGAAPVSTASAAGGPAVGPTAAP